MSTTATDSSKPSLTSKRDEASATAANIADLLKNAEQGLRITGLVLLVGLGLHGVLRRRADALPPGLRTFGPRLVLLLALGVPALILLFSVFRVIPAGHVGVKVLFGQVDPTTAGPWRRFAGPFAPPGEATLSDDGGTAFRFLLVFDSSIATDIEVTKVTLVYRSI